MTLLTRVVDRSVVVSVRAAQDLDKLSTVLTVAEAALQLLERDATIVVGIEGLENLFQLLDIIGIGLHSDGHQSDLLKLLALAEVLHVLDLELLDRLLRRLTVLVGVVAHPRVLQSLTCGETALRSHDQLLDQVFGFVADGVPLLTIKLELTNADHLKDLLVVVTVEGRVSAKQDVEHAASAPHVARDVIVARKHLR